MHNFNEILKKYLSDHKNYKPVSYYLNNDSLYVLINDGSAIDLFESGLIIKINKNKIVENTMLDGVKEWKLNLNDFNKKILEEDYKHEKLN